MPVANAKMETPHDAEVNKRLVEMAEVRQAIA